MKNKLHHLYVSGPESLYKAHDRFGGPQGLLRNAAETIKPTETRLAGAGPDAAIDDEAGSLIHFGREAGLIMEPSKVLDLFEQNKLRGGSEHRVAHLREQQRVIKDLNANHKATESLFDYLTDLMLANCLFGDDIQLEGLYLESDELHVITSQPFIAGIHPDWETLKAGMAARGFRHENPLSRTPTFCLDVLTIGEVSIIDLHENNVILGSASGAIEPIDGHFYFDCESQRISALRTLGLLG